MEQVVWKTVEINLQHPSTEHALLIIGLVEGALYPIGSGVFVTPQLVMTAKHVVDDFYRVADRPKGKGQVNELPFKIRVVQWPNGEQEAAWWAMTGIWEAQYTDVAFLSVVPNCDVSRRHQVRVPKVNVLPPSVGEAIVGIGYAGSKMLGKVPGGSLIGLRPTAALGRVIANYDHYHSRGFLEFPCFEIRAQFIGGMSGGPIFNEAGELCGLVCAGDDNHAIAWAVTLWAAVVTGITHDADQTPLVQAMPVWAFLRKGGTLVGSEGLGERVVLEDDPMGKKTIKLLPKASS